MTRKARGSGAIKVCISMTSEERTTIDLGAYLVGEDRSTFLRTAGHERARAMRVYGTERSQHNGLGRR